MNVATIAYFGSEGAVPALQASEVSAELLLGNKAFRHAIPAIQALRIRLGQENDLTTDPEYFMALLAGEKKRPAAVLLRSPLGMVGCVLLYEHTLFGFGLGLFHGGDYVGESLVVGHASHRTQLVAIAARTLLERWRIHGVSLSMKATKEECVDLMGPESECRRFAGKTVQHNLPLERTYSSMLSSFGPRTRRSLAGKREHLEKNPGAHFLPDLSVEAAREAIEALRPVSEPTRSKRFFHARLALLERRSNFFSMALRHPNGTWLSLLMGWRIDGVTYIDIQLNHSHFKKESLSAVMRAFMIEHEIGRKQRALNFVGGSSLLLRRYCRPAEPYTDAFLRRSCLRGRLLAALAAWVRPGSVYERLEAPADEARPTEIGD